MKHKIWVAAALSLATVSAYAQVAVSETRGRAAPCPAKRPPACS